MSEEENKEEPVKKKRGRPKKEKKEKKQEEKPAFSYSHPEPPLHRFESSRRYITMTVWRSKTRDSMVNFVLARSWKPRGKSYYQSVKLPMYPMELNDWLACIEEAVLWWRENAHHWPDISDPKKPIKPIPSKLKRGETKEEAEERYVIRSRMSVQRFLEADGEKVPEIYPPEKKYLGEENYFGEVEKEPEENENKIKPDLPF